MSESTTYPVQQVIAVGFGDVVEQDGIYSWVWGWDLQQSSHPNDASTGVSQIVQERMLFTPSLLGNRGKLAIFCAARGPLSRVTVLLLHRLSECHTASFGPHSVGVACRSDVRNRATLRSR